MPDRNREEPRIYLSDDQAARWFYSQRGGDMILDRHLSLMHATFGRDVPYRLRAAVDPATGQPRDLIIEIMLPVDDAAAWDLLVELQQRLLGEARDLRSRTTVRFPFRHIVVSLAGAPSAWFETVDVIEGVQ